MNNFKKPYGKKDTRGAYRPTVQKFDAICSNCGKACQVPFRPDGQKPVYCKDCFGAPRGTAPSGEGKTIADLTRQDRRDERQDRHDVEDTERRRITYLHQAMQIRSATFMRGVNGTDELLDDGTPQVALIGRSNVGKSSIINSLTGQKALARTSDTPGLTQEINIYSINNKFYLLDLPGYGFAKVPEKVRESLQKLNWWYLFDSENVQRHAVLVLDANVGPSKNDIEMLTLLREHRKDIVIVANKIDKIPRGEYDARIAVITDLAHGLPVIPYSSKTGIGAEELANILLGQ